jgi:translation initiation factor IF-2
MDEDPTKLENRPPVITILGHVDHGKTTLLDAVRHTNVAGGEAGGITQHIGAYQVTHKNRLITFLDTPGHAAFSSMRARGAKGADIVILVVAADDGVQPQTKEAVNHAKAAQVPIVVALNKIDKPDANPDLVKRQLAAIGLQPMNGKDTFVVPVSAKTRKGLDDLLETILLVADNMVIKANPKGACIGTVVEAKLDKTTGPMATLLVQNGTLKVGNVIVAGESYGKIKAMFDQRHKRIDKAGPSTPVMVMGLDHLPDAGDLFQVVENEREARQIVEGRKAERESRRSLKRATLEELFAKEKSGETKELRLILKADVRGSLEPIVNSLEDLGKKEKDISIQVLHSETGNITESDVALAAASNAVILAFNVDVDQNTKHLAEAEGVSIRVYKSFTACSKMSRKRLRACLNLKWLKKLLAQHRYWQLSRSPRPVWPLAAGCWTAKSAVMPVCGLCARAKWYLPVRFPH